MNILGALTLCLGIWFQMPLKLFFGHKEEFKTQEFKYLQHLQTKHASKKRGQWVTHIKQCSNLISGIQSDGTLRKQPLLPFHGSQEWPHQAVLDGRDLGRTWCSHHRYSAWHIGWAACFRQNLGRGGWRCFQQTSQHGFPRSRNVEVLWSFTVDQQSQQKSPVWHLHPTPASIK